MSYVVSVENVSKKFCRGIKQGMLYTVQDVARDLIGYRPKEVKLRPTEFWVNKDLNFELKHGDSLGLLGTNGAGKSTLLKMLNGIIEPDKGRIRMRGRIGALIEVGAGFHPMLTGRENIYINGAILGMSKREIDRKFDAIVEFSGLSGAILEAPVKTYSSGMYVRLGFSVAIHCDPEILLVDEVLAVGDGAFRVRCTDWITAYLKGSGTLILVSHYLPSIRESCNKVMLLEKGVCRYFGETLPGLQEYQNSMSRPAAAQEEGRRSTGGSYTPLKFTSVRVLSTQGDTPSGEFDHRQPWRIVMELTAEEPVEGAHLHLIFPGSDARTVCGWTSRLASPEGLNFSVGSHRMEVDMGAMSLVPGNYSVVAFVSERTHLADYHEFIGPHFSVREHPIVDDRFGWVMLGGNLMEEQTPRHITRS